MQNGNISNDWYHNSMSHSVRDIVILGNSGFARECFIMLREMMKHDSALRFQGFLSFEGYQADLRELSDFFLGVDDDYAFKTGQLAVIGIGDPELRKKAHTKLVSRDVSFFTLIHPNTYIDPTVNLGEANIFGTNCHIGCNCAIGSGNVLNGLVHVGHDAVIGDHNFIGPGVQILGKVTIGSLNSLGASSVLLPQAKIGDGNIIAPLSAVYKGCGSGVYMSGNPAVKMGRRNV